MTSGRSVRNPLVEEAFWDPWVGWGVAALAVEAASLLAGPPAWTGCLVQPANQRFRLIVKMVAGFSI
jgi:hypothetical protein